MNASEVLTVHQILGRIVYFHALFIEPALTDANPPRMLAARPSGPRLPCCNHAAAPAARVSVIPALRESAWSVLEEIVASLPAPDGCPGKVEQCCATCQVQTTGTVIAGCWMSVEQRAYGTKPPAPGVREAWNRAVGMRLANVFAAQHDAVCDGLNRAATTPETVRLPTPEELPLTSELLALWSDPTVRQPVVSWLNHCTGTDDVARVLEARRANV